MPILAIDTASRWTAIALYDEENEQILAKKRWTATLRQTAELAPAIDQMLSDARLSTADLTALTVAIGPGSYTGLRIGFSLAQGLSLIHDLPIAAVPTHDIVAARVQIRAKPLWVAVEAGRKRVLIAPYTAHNGRWVQQGDIDNPTWPELLESVSEPLVLAGEIPDDVLERIKTSTTLIELAAESESIRSAGTLAKLGHQQIVSGRLPDQNTLAPVYLRTP